MRQSSSRRSCLQAQTAHIHERIHGTIGPLESFGSYTRYIQGLYAFRQPLESMLQAMPSWPETVGDWRPQFLSRHIAADMEDLGIEPEAEASEDGRMPDKDGLIGILYVLEGASVGARMLIRQAMRLGLREDFGARHLAHQSGQAQSWQTFLTILEHGENLNMERAGEAAITTFEAAHQAFRKTVYATYPNG